MAEKRSVIERRQKSYDGYAKRMKWALLLSASLHGGVIFHKQGELTVRTVPRWARMISEHPRAEAEAKQFLAEFENQLEKGEPLDLNLIDFYLEQEVLSGGVTPEEAQRAKQRFNEIITEAERIKEQTRDRDATLNYILRHQGEYVERSNNVSDLLNSGHGNCSARIKYVGAAVQQLYPETVENGDVKVEDFGAYQTKEGKNVPGHVRVVIDEGETVSILEGSKVLTEPVESHADIPSYEVTEITAKAHLARHGLYDYTGDHVVEELREKKGLERFNPFKYGLERSGGWEYATDDLLVYPPSAAVYGESARSNIDIPQSPEGREAYTARDISNKPIELTILKLRLTAEHWKDSWILREAPENHTIIDLSPYLEIDAEVWQEIKSYLEKTEEKILPKVIIRIRGDQQIPKEIFVETPLRVEVTTPLEIDHLQGVPIRSLVLNVDLLSGLQREAKVKSEALREIAPGVFVREYIFEDIPYQRLPQLDQLHWAPNAELVIKFISKAAASTEQGGSVITFSTDGQLQNLNNVRRLKLVNERRDKNDPFIQMLFQTDELKDIPLYSLTFDNVLPLTLGRVQTNKLKVVFSKDASFLSEPSFANRGMLAEVRTPHMSLEYPGQFHSTWFDGADLRATNVFLSVDIIGANAFAGYTIKGLATFPRQFPPDAAAFHSKEGKPSTKIGTLALPMSVAAFSNWVRGEPGNFDADITTIVLIDQLGENLSQSLDSLAREGHFPSTTREIVLVSSSSDILPIDMLNVNTPGYTPPSDFNISRWPIPKR